MTLRQIITTELLDKIGAVVTKEETNWDHDFENLRFSYPEFEGRNYISITIDGLGPDFQRCRMNKFLKIDGDFCNDYHIELKLENLKSIVKDWTGA